MAETVYILSGSNIGDREKNLNTALAKVEIIPGLELIATSAIYVSEAQDMVGEIPTFMNQVIMADYQYLPGELLNELEAIECKMGRTDKGRMLPRTIDLDILLFGERIINTDRLVVPHRRLLKRPFAMVPLLQITPDVIHPVQKRPVAEFLKEKDRQKVILFKDHVARSL